MYCQVEEEMSKLLPNLNGAPRVRARAAGLTFMGLSGAGTRTWTAALCAALVLGVPSAASAAVETYEPGLSALVAPQAAQLQAAGIKSILTRTGKHRRDIQLQTQWGPAYFSWPKNVTPALFEIYIANDGTAEVYTDENYKDSTQGALRCRVQCDHPRGCPPGAADTGRRTETEALARQKPSRCLWVSAFAPLLNRAPHQSNVFAQRIALAGHALRQADVRHGVLDPIEVVEPAFDRQIALSALNVPLK